MVLRFIQFARAGSEFAEAILPVFGRCHASQAFDVIEGPEYGADASAVAQVFPELPLVVRLHTPTFVINEINELYRPWYWKARFVIRSAKARNNSKIILEVRCPYRCRTRTHVDRSRNYGSLQCYPCTCYAKGGPFRKSGFRKFPTLLFHLTALLEIAAGPQSESRDVLRQT